MLRFVLLRHELPESNAKESHWDLMLEQPPTGSEAIEHRLLTWSLNKLPTAWHELLGNRDLIKNEPCEKAFSLEVTQLENHRAHYLDYEGPISGDASGDRGTVTRWASGQIKWAQTNGDRKETPDYTAQILSPSPLAGELTLKKRVSASPTGKPSVWELNWTSFQ